MNGFIIVHYKYDGVKLYTASISRCEFFHFCIFLKSCFLGGGGWVGGEFIRIILIHYLLVILVSFYQKKKRRILP